MKELYRTYRLFLGKTRFNRDIGMFEQESVEVKVKGGLKELKESDAWQFYTSNGTREARWDMIKEEWLTEEEANEQS